MKTYTVLALLLVMALTACHPQNDSIKQRLVFEAGDQTMITSSVNKKLETMTVLYGNAAAYKAALQTNGTKAGEKHEAGEQFTLVTWKYHGNPYFEGSQINGELLSVERLNINTAADSTIAMQYHVEVGTVLPVNGQQLSQQQRIQYILGYRPSVFP